MITGNKILPLPPPPQRTWSAYGGHGKFMLLPPPTKSGRLLEITENVCYYPPSPNLVGFWRSRKMYRVTSAGWPPPQQKSWLRRWMKGVNWEEEFYGKDVNGIWEVICDKITDAVERNVPKMKTNMSKKAKPIWMMKAVKAKYNSWKTYTRSK